MNYAIDIITASINNLNIYLHVLTEHSDPRQPDFLAIKSHQIITVKEVLGRTCRISITSSSSVIFAIISSSISVIFAIISSSIEIFAIVLPPRSNARTVARLHGKVTTYSPCLYRGHYPSSLDISRRSQVTQDLNHPTHLNICNTIVTRKYPSLPRTCKI